MNIPTLKTLYSKNYVVKGCIKGKYANNNLSNFLNKLSDPEEYGILKKQLDKDGLTRYRVSEHFEGLITLHNLGEILKSMSPDELVNILSLYKPSDELTKFHIEYKGEKYWIYDKRPDFKIKDEIEFKKELPMSISQIEPYLLGLNEDFFKKCNEKELDLLDKSFKNIIESANLIANLKYSKTGKTSGIIYVIVVSAWR
jgi:hypothetical protein